jgi:hypothetical protein
MESGENAMHHGAEAAGRLRSVVGRRSPPLPSSRKDSPSLAAFPIPTTTARSSLLPATLIGGYLQRSTSGLSLVHYVDFESGRGKGWMERGLPNYEEGKGKGCTLIHLFILLYGYSTVRRSNRSHDPTIYRVPAARAFSRRARRTRVGGRRRKGCRDIRDRDR